MSEKINKEAINKTNSLVNKYLCNFIAVKFLQTPRDQAGKEISQNKYADLCGLSSSTLTKLNSSNGYDLPMSTIYNICRHEKYTLKKLFEEFEKEYGVNIPE